MEKLKQTDEFDWLVLMGMALEFKQIQYPIGVAFAMTINKSKRG